MLGFTRYLLPFFLLFSTSPVASQALDQPQGTVILEISGQVAVTNTEGAAQFDLEMLEALDQLVIDVETPWHEGPQQFSGPRLVDLMAAVGAVGSELRFVAINDYAANMPWDDIQAHDVILASRQNGDTMSVRDKGPLFVIYPFNENPELRNEVYYGRSVWQVKAIQVLP
ncbi:hypothetical protein [Roseinatronobacter sp. S2]|uniref:hypothetical protein n=1 Tax=Roseinatronobacter sp. S2 TaxID=3035471 RepID=UPI00240F07ED|nr:hypothetical protein [Roseinatronobacter sp. S2]WFE76286.1 hypothetical protein P8S53_07765 [Roseinatronobacter sp. S2]